jgi:hypothetical protein
MVNRLAPIAAEYVVRRVLILPKVSANLGVVSFKRGVSLPISSVTALFPCDGKNKQSPLRKARCVQ